MLDFFLKEQSEYHSSEEYARSDTGVECFPVMHETHVDSKYTEQGVLLIDWSACQYFVSSFISSFIHHAALRWRWRTFSSLGSVYYNEDTSLNSNKTDVLLMCHQTIYSRTQDREVQMHRHPDSDIRKLNIVRWSYFILITILTESRKTDCSDFLQQDTLLIELFRWTNNWMEFRFKSWSSFHMEVICHWSYLAQLKNKYWNIVKIGNFSKLLVNL